MNMRLVMQKLEPEKHENKTRAKTTNNEYSSETGCQTLDYE